MKLRTLIFLSLILSLVSVAFAQDKPAKPGDDKAAKPAAPVDNKAAKPAPLPATAEILAKYVKAIGGRETNEKIKNRIIKTSLEISPMGLKGSMEIYAAAPDKTYSLVTIAGIGDVIEGFDGKSAWVIHPINGNREKSGVELLQTKLAANFHREINLDKLYSKLEVKGIEKVGDKEAYAVVGTAEGVPTETFYFDTVSGLLIRMDSTAVSPEGNIPVKTFFDDYREVDGIMIAHKMRSVMAQMEIINIVTSVKNDGMIDEAKFAKPKQ